MKATITQHGPYIVEWYLLVSAYGMWSILLLLPLFAPLVSLFLPLLFPLQNHNLLILLLIPLLNGTERMITLYPRSSCLLTILHSGLSMGHRLHKNRCTH